MKSEQELKNEIMMIWSAPPSQSIFIRQDMAGNPFLYDDVTYEYCPECDLYVRIVLAGFDAYHSEKADIIRKPSTHKKSSWHFFVDRFTLLMKYREYLSPAEYNSKLMEISHKVVRTSLGSRDPQNIISFAVSMIRKTSLLNFMRSI